MVAYPEPAARVERSRYPETNRHNLQKQNRNNQKYTGSLTELMEKHDAKKKFASCF
jgi:hypothetical protein